MNLTDENKSFHHAVYSVVEQIPLGKVTSYGHIAYLLGKPSNSRQVGSSLKHCAYIIPILNESSTERDTKYDLSNFPWWRVLSSTGKISPRENKEAEYVQADRLREEDVVVKNLKVDLEEVGWFPEEVDF